MSSARRRFHQGGSSFNFISPRLAFNGSAGQELLSYTFPVLLSPARAPDSQYNAGLKFVELERVWHVPTTCPLPKVTGALCHVTYSLLLLHPPCILLSFGFPVIHALFTSNLEMSLARLASMPPELKLVTCTRRDSLFSSFSFFFFSFRADPSLL